jgi:hypothetical protein
MMDHRGHDYTPTPGADLLRQRDADLARILAGTTTPSPSLLERMVYGPQPLTAASRDLIKIWVEP